MHADPKAWDPYIAYQEKYKEYLEIFLDEADEEEFWAEIKKLPIDDLFMIIRGALSINLHQDMYTVGAIADSMPNATVAANIINTTQINKVIDILKFRQIEASLPQDSA